MDDLLKQIKRFIPKRLFDAAAPTYHYLLALGGATFYRFPAKKLTIIGVTGTKGKSSTTEILNAIFEAAGHKTALINTIRFKVAGDSKANRRKMTIPGRFFVQKSLRQAVNEGCEVAILEISSEAVKQFRHKFIYLDALVFTNLSPEHIESHGSYEKYRAAKLAIAQGLLHNLKGKQSIMIANADDPEAEAFLCCGASMKVPFTIKDAGIYTIDETGITFNFKNTKIHSPLRGTFNLYNCLAAATAADAFGVSSAAIKDGLESLSLIRGRVEFVKLPADHPSHEKQNFDVVVDYAHTSGSLTELYKTFGDRRKVCVLGNTGGGRDKWKRPEMAAVADMYCDVAILTNEDPYDEDPDAILNDMLPGFKEHPATVIMDRREAIREAISRASTLRQAQGPSDKNPVVLITGKGTDPYIMLADNEKLEWSDYEVAKEELEKVLENR